jgi:hypothetical protein
VSKVVQTLDLLDRSALPRQFVWPGELAPGSQVKQVVQEVVALALDGLRPVLQLAVLTGSYCSCRIPGGRCQALQKLPCSSQRSWRSLQFTLQPLQSKRNLRRKLGGGQCFGERRLTASHIQEDTHGVLEPGKALPWKNLAIGQLQQSWTQREQMAGEIAAVHG